MATQPTFYPAAPGDYCVSIARDNGAVRHHKLLGIDSNLKPVVFPPQPKATIIAIPVSSVAYFCPELDREFGDLNYVVEALTQ